MIKNIPNSKFNIEEQRAIREERSVDEKIRKCENEVKTAIEKETAKAGAKQPYTNKKIEKILANFAKEMGVSLSEADKDRLKGFPLFFVSEVSLEAFRSKTAHPGSSWQLRSREKLNTSPELERKLQLHELIKRIKERDGELA